MNKLRRFFKNHKSGRRYLDHGNPSRGISYNNISDNRIVCKRIYDFDIARTPQVIKDLGMEADLQGNSWKINSHYILTNYKAHKAKGRSR